MNILEIISGDKRNGAILHCLMVSRELARRGNRVTVACLPDSWIAGELAHDAGSPDQPEVIHSDLHRWPPDELRRVAREVEQRGIEVIHTHTSRSNFFGVLLRYVAGIPSVATAHSRHIQLHWMFNDRVVAISEASRRYQQRYNMVRGSRIDLVHNFIDLERFPADLDGQREPLRQRLGVDEGTPLLIAVGDIMPRKGQIHLLEALSVLRRDLPDARLLLVGPSNHDVYYEQTRRRAEELRLEEAVVWLGPRGDVPQLLAAADLYVLASIEESFPLSILEAMAAGLPVVATDVGGVAECVAHGENGLLVPPRQPEALAEAVHAVLTDRLRGQQFGWVGRRRVLREFSPESQAPKLEAVFQRAIEGHGGLRRRAA